MTKVLLINPPGTLQDGFTNPPLGLLYIAGTLRANNINVSIVDGCIKGWDGIHQALKTYKPDIAGITCLTPQRKKALQAAKLAKDCNPNILTIIGGAHPTIMYKQLLENYPFVDIAVLGEGEQSMLKIAKEIKVNSRDLFSSLSKINGIAYRQSKDAIKTGNGENVKDLDSLPLPTWDVVEFDKYVKWGKGIKNGINLEKEPRISVVFSRGCKGHCDFCSSWWIWKKWRHRSPANMVDELELLNKKYGIRHINFADDTTTVNREATVELCEEIMKRKLKIAFLLSTRADCIDPEMLYLLKKAGCYKIAYGVESGSQTILDKLGKETNIETTKKALLQTKLAGIDTCALIIVGNQGETEETVNETIDFLNETNPTEVGSVGGLWVLPGTKLYRHCKEQGAIDDSFWLGDEPYMLYTLEHSREEIERFFRAVQERKKFPVSKVLPQNAISQRQVFSHRWQRYLQHDKNEYSATTEWIEAQKLHIELMQQIPPDCKDILDLGCGDGWSVNTLKNKEKNAIGLSCNLKEIEHAKKTYNLDIVYGDMHELPFDNYSFDCIYSRESYEHSIAPYIAMCEMNRVLKPDGFIMINVPDEKWIREDSHFSVLTPAQMEEMFYKCKFELVRNGRSSANHYWYLAQKKGDLEVNVHSPTVATEPGKNNSLPRIVCMMRIKNEEQWIAETLTEISKIADAIVILDDGSTDKTPEICKSFPKVVRYEYKSEQVIDEVRDKNKLLRWALELKPDWILAMDGDEVLESKAKEKIIKEIETCPPEVSAFEFEFLYFWDTKKRYRVDGKYNKIFHPRLFKLANQIVENLTFIPTEHGSNFHGGSIPNNLIGQSKKTFVRVKHYGYLDRSDRKKKYDWYCANDPVNAKKGYYEHLIDKKGMILIDWNEDGAILSTPSLLQKPPYYYANARPEIVQLIPETAKQILDVGCGYGAMGELIKKKIPLCKVIGIEINQEAAQIAAQRLNHVIVGDVEHLEVNERFGRFDCIIFADVLEHLVNPWLALKKFGAMLSDNGTIIASIPNVGNLTVINNLVSGKWSYQEQGILDETHLRFFTRGEIEKMFKNCGYEISKLLPVHDPSLGNESQSNIGSINIEVDNLVIKHVSKSDLDELTAIQFLVVTAPKSASLKKPIITSRTSNIKTGLATSILNRGNTLISLGKLDEAIKEFEKLVNLHPDCSDGYVSLATAYHKRGDSPKAEENFKKAIELDANNISALKNLAHLYFDKKDYNQGISTCEAILLKDCKDADTLVLLSNCYFEMNAYEAALIGYQKALELSPKLKDAKRGIALVKAKLKTNKIASSASGGLAMTSRSNKKIKNKATCSIIIPTYNKVEYTKQCLASLLENTDYENYEIIVVDNASTDGTKDFLKTFNGTINVIANNNNLGFAKACNQGAKIATGKYLVFLNNDTTPHPGWLTEMVKLVETNERIAIVGNKQIYPAQNPTLGGMIWHAGVVINENRVSQCIYNGYDQNHPFVNKIREFPAVAGSCMLVRKDVFEKLNGLDEIYLNSHEDIDFCLRAREAGYKVMYCPTSVIEHHVSISEGRHDSESRNAEIFRQRWAKRLEQDDLKYYEEDAKEFLGSYKFRKYPSRRNGLPDMPNIGFLSTYNQKCGLATYAQQLLVHYDPSKVLIFAEHGKDILPNPDPINLIRCWTRYSPDYHFIVELVRKHNIPLIHINNQRGLLSQPLVDFMQHLYQDGCRTVVTFHSTVRFNIAERECFKFIDKAIVHTPENKLELIANGCDEKKIVVISHGVPEAKLVDRYTARQRLNLPQGQNIITSFGFVQESKGIHEIIGAVASLKANGVPVKYFILGTSHPHSQDSKTYLEKCKALALRLGVANLVAFKDEYLSDDTVLQYLHASDAIIMNYKSNTYESSGATAFAIAACRPLITSNAPMFATFGDACLHVSDAHPLELAIYNVLSDPFLRSYVQKNALKFIEENNWQRIAEKHFLLYAEVMSKTSQTSINLIERYGSHPDNIYDEDFQKERIDWLKSKVNGRILEVGCATGFVSEYVGAFAALDIDEGRLGVSNRLRKSCRFIKADATKGIPFKDKSFDTVILAEVLEHVPFDKSKAMLSEAIRVGKNLLVTIPYDGEVKHEELSNNIEHFWLGNEENIKELFLSVSNIKPNIEFSSKRDFIMVEQQVDSIMPRIPKVTPKTKKHLTPDTPIRSEDNNKSNPDRQSIHWLGGFFGLDGYSTAARNYALGLSEIGVDVSTEPLFDGCPITKESQ